MADFPVDSLPTGRPRPALFRALGANDPPPAITVGGLTYCRVEIFKHDSWAATALYSNGNAKIVCKFNRQQSLLGLPARWLGRWLARREADFYETLADLPGVPQGCGRIAAEGVELPYAVAHAFVEGRPLKRSDRLPDRFFQDLRSQLEVIHSRGIAYMDLHKRENIILGGDGQGYLIDFQVSIRISKATWFAPARWFLRACQTADLYHLHKHELRLGLERPAERQKQLDAARPAFLRAHRLIARPLRELRRRLLVALGVRRGVGRVQTEHFTENGLAVEPSQRRAA